MEKHLEIPMVKPKEENLACSLVDQMEMLKATLKVMS